MNSVLRGRKDLQWLCGGSSRNGTRGFEDGEESLWGWERSCAE